MWSPGWYWSGVPLVSITTRMVERLHTRDKQHLELEHCTHITCSLSGVTYLD